MVFFLEVREEMSIPVDRSEAQITNVASVERPTGLASHGSSAHCDASLLN
jgi:hypothetical protein